MGRTLAIIGMGLSLVYAVGVIWVFEGRLLSLGSMDLNNAGDFLAGVFGPLAVLWLVLGFFQQGIELRLQAKELRASVDQQAELVGISKDQLNMAKNNTELEHDRLESEIAPKFSLDFVKVDEFGTDYVFNFGLTNGGHTITCLQFAFDNRSFLKAAMLSAGSCISLEQRLVNPDRIMTKELRVEYLDGLERKRFRKFEIYFHRGLSGSWSVYSLKPQGESVDGLGINGRPDV